MELYTFFLILICGAIIPLICTLVLSSRDETRFTKIACITTFFTIAIVFAGIVYDKSGFWFIGYLLGFVPASICFFNKLIK